MKIALVDDEQKYLDEMAALIRDFSTQYCCQVETVPFLNGETFLEAFEGSGFSAVFMDIYMDGMDGVAAALKAGDRRTLRDERARPSASRTMGQGAAIPADSKRSFP